MTPSKLVAPVGSEVVLLAGLCGSDGYYLTKQPIEWLLSQESVGNFVGVGEDNYPTLTQLLHKPPKKMSSNFAIARSSAQARVITRGTDSQVDDIWLQKGQSWVTLSSASEGTTHVTAMAANSDNWEQRRQTATIQWVDAQWVLPSPAIVRSGQAHLLSTTISRSSTGTPIRNRIVRYEVISGPPVQFGTNGSQTVDVSSDANGRAAVNVQPTTPDPGVTQIKIEILSPSLTGLNGDPVVIGHSTTTITWSAAGLSLRVLGPTTTAIGSTVTYQIEVSNPGDLPADNVVVSAELPPVFKFVDGEGQFGTRQEWRIDRLAPRSARTLTLRARAVGPGSVSLFVTANGTGVSAEPFRAATEIQQSALKLSVDLVDGEADSINVGDTVSYNISVTNTSNTPVSNVIVRDVFDAGLSHLGGERSPITKSLGNLAPGAVREFAVKLVVQQAGRLCHTVDVSADGGHTAESEPKCITASQAARELTVDFDGSTDITDREKASYEVVVRNTGEVELTGISIKVTIDPSLNPTFASKNHQVLDTNVLAWRVVSIEPGKSVTRTIECEPAAFKEKATVTVHVATDQGLTKSKSVHTKIRPTDGPAPVAPEARPPAADEPANLQPPANGSLKVELDDATAGVAVGQPIVYVLKITNDRQGFDDDIRVNLRFSEAVSFTDVTLGGQVIQNVSVEQDRRSASLFFQQMRARDEIILRIQARAELAGEGMLEVDVTSQQAPQGVSVTEVTPIRAN